MTNINEDKKRIIEIESTLKQAYAKIDPQKGIDNWEELWNLENELLQLKRKVFLYHGEETAVPIETAYPQCCGAPIPHVISNGHKTLLLFYIGKSNPKWDEKENDIIVLDENSKNFIALFNFKFCKSIKYGGVNDEALNGHPLYNRGLVPYEMHEIRNSAWIAEIKKMNSVHSYYDEKYYSSAKHIIFTFHDDIFECIADNYTVQIFKGKLSEVYKIASDILFDNYKE